MGEDPTVAADDEFTAGFGENATMPEPVPGMCVPVCRLGGMGMCVCMLENMGVCVCRLGDMCMCVCEGICFVYMLV